MKFAKGQRVVFVTTPDESSNHYATRWERMTFTVVRCDSSDFVHVRLDKKVDYWEGMGDGLDCHFSIKFLHPHRDHPFGGRHSDLRARPI